MIEDHVETFEIVKSMLEYVPEIRCAGWHRSIREFTNREVRQADIFLVDIELPDGKGLHLIGGIKNEFPRSKVMIFTAFEDEDLLLDAIAFGADGFLVKGQDTERLAGEIMNVAFGGFSLTGSLARRILQRQSGRICNSTAKGKVIPLTPREVEILQFIALGLSTKEVADELDVSHHTVRRHVEHIYQKLQVTNRTQAIRIARRRGILDTDEDS